MQNSKNSDKTLIISIEEFNDSDKNVILISVTRYWKDFKKEIYLFAEKFKIDIRLSKLDMDKIKQDREEIRNYIDECESECFLKCQED